MNVFERATRQTTALRANSTAQSIFKIYLSYQGVAIAMESQLAGIAPFHNKEFTVWYSNLQLNLRFAKRIVEKVVELVIKFYIMQRERLLWKYGMQNLFLSDIRSILYLWNNNQRNSQWSISWHLTGHWTVLVSVGLVRYLFLKKNLVVPYEFAYFQNDSLLNKVRFTNVSGTLILSMVPSHYF